MRRIDVHGLMHHPGASRRVGMSEQLDGVSTEIVSVTDPIQIKGLLEGVEEGVLVSGTVAGRMSCICARCLEEFSAEIDMEVRELFTPVLSEEEDGYPIIDGEVDLEPCIRDAVMLSIPFAPLCKEGCLGLCPRCGGDRNLSECSCGPERDERWAALSTLKLED